MRDFLVDEKEKYDPSAFRDAIVQGFNEAGTDLEQVCTKNTPPPPSAKEKSTKCIIALNFCIYSLKWLMCIPHTRPCEVHLKLSCASTLYTKSLLYIFARILKLVNNTIFLKVIINFSHSSNQEEQAYSA